MSGLLGELFGVDYNGTFNFFLSGLREVTNRKPCDQMFYVATVLGHYTQVPRYGYEQIFFGGLGELFDQLVLHPTNDLDILEIGGSHIILFGGYFRDQIKHRYDVEWYDNIGQGFYYQIGRYARSKEKRDFFLEFA